MLRHHRATRHYRRIFIFSAFLLELVSVGCSLSVNLTVGRPEAELEDNGTGYQKTGRMVTLTLWALSRLKPPVRQKPDSGGLWRHGEFFKEKCSSFLCWQLIEQP
ncbi:hypothetical protein AVEN_34915-1 [Araneus ventricosus]|uniref:Secreted protein n=1 Tax=Araneus ventricosus TaxID=182803 RepID=A0A4Y2S1Q8_ARAVE|nr:hypothetical protein AVEN_34915-1 [Araneus ventricosus]